MPFQYIKTSFSSGELTPGLAGRVDIDKYQIGCETLENMYSEVYGSASNRPGTKFILETKNNDKAILKDFRYSSSDVYVLVFTPNTLRFIFEGGFVESSPGVPYEISTPYSASEIETLTFTQSADVMWIFADNNIVKKLVRTSPSTFTLTNFTTQAPTSFTPTGLSASAQVPGVVGKLNISYNDIGLINPTVAVKDVSETPPGVGTLIITRNAGGTNTADYISWSESGGVYTFSLDPSWSPSSAASINNSVTIADKDWSYVVTGLKDAQESQPTAPVQVDSTPNLATDKKITLTWTNAGSAESFNVYRFEQGAYYWIGTTEDTTFVDEGYEWDGSTSPPGDSIATNRTPWNLNCGVIYNQRLIIASTPEKPNTFWASQAGLFDDFSQSFIAKSTDAFERALDAGQINEIRHMIQIGSTLIMLTSGGTWSVGSTDNSIFSADTVTAGWQGDISVSRRVAPLIASNDVMVVQDKGQSVSPLTYNLDQDGYIGNDVSIWAKHLFDGYEIIDWCYQKNPSNIIWMVRNDGALIGLTYLKEQRIWAFHKHFTGQDVGGGYEKVLSIESIPDFVNLRDDVYMCIERVVDGNTVRYIEELAPRGAEGGLGEHTWYVDCGGIYSGSATSNISGLDHLEGRDVTGIAWDADTVPFVVTGTVSSGSVDIGAQVTDAIIGLPYVSTIKTMRISTADIFNTMQGEKKKITECIVRVQDSTTFQIAQSPEAYRDSRDTTIDTGTNGVISQDSRETGPGGMTYDGQIFIQNSTPTPLTVQALIMEVDTA